MQKTFAPLERKERLKLSVLRFLHLGATARSSVTSDAKEHCFSEAEFGIVDLNRNVEDEKAEVKI